MQILSAESANFGSYKNLSFNFENLGLALVYGPTGSGKSTLLDLSYWILFGSTAKGVSVDQVRNWSTENEATTGILRIRHNSGVITVTRIRGRAQDNDLYWQETNTSDEKHRGKDLLDTQNLLNVRLRISEDFYCAATYFNEFSEAGLFFLARSKVQRELFEKLTPLEFPVKLSMKLTEYKKKLKKELVKLEQICFITKGKLQQMVESKKVIEQHARDWEVKKAKNIEEAEARVKFFDKEKASKIQAFNTKSYQFEEDKKKKHCEYLDKLDALDQKILSPENLEHVIIRLKESNKSLVCVTCNRPNVPDKKLEELERQLVKNNRYKEQFSDYSNKILDLQAHKNTYIEQIKAEQSRENHWEDYLKMEKATKNVFAEQLDLLNESIFQTNEEATTNLLLMGEIQYDLDSCDQLQDLSLTMRTVLLQNVVKKIQNNTNVSLEKYFDSEFRVDFTLEGSDNLKVDITKNSRACVYKQLSKGQRQMLKLCFALAIMAETANNLGISFNLLCFDEPLDGLSSELKMKAVALFSDLQKTHESILVIDHSPEFQNVFYRKFSVELISDNSIVYNE